MQRPQPLTAAWDCTYASVIRAAVLLTPAFIRDVLVLTDPKEGCSVHAVSTAMCVGLAQESWGSELLLSRRCTVVSLAF